MLRLGLFLYDHLDWHMTLPKSIAVDLPQSKFGVGLKPSFKKGFVYSDAWVDDARLVIANVKSARQMGARIFARHRCVSARRSDDGKLWNIELAGPDGASVQLKARGLVNATGPWVKRFLDEQTHIKTAKRVRLIKGSHIIVPRLHEGDHAFILQNSDHRIVFIIPYERDFSLIGTTDIPVEASETPVCTPEEIAYLCEIASHYMVKPVTPADVVWTYSGVRPLFDDGDDNPSAVTRDYHLEVDGARTSARRRAAAVGVRRQDHDLPAAGRACADGSRAATIRTWACHGPPTAALADGELADAPTFEEAFDRYRRQRRLGEARPAQGARARARRAGTARASTTCWRASRRWPISASHFGGHLYEAEVRYLMRDEWAVEAEDVLWRRTKEGLHMTAAERGVSPDG